MNALVYVDIDQGIHKGEDESCSKWKTKKTTWVFFLYKYRKFWSISLEFKLERKSFILEVCPHVDEHGFCSTPSKTMWILGWILGPPPKKFFLKYCFQKLHINLSNLHNKVKFLSHMAVMFFKKNEKWVKER